jgi:HPt (histidine-containing phosphotransfer) domain-containing protein
VDLRAFNDITDGDASFAQELIATFISVGEQQVAGLLAAVDAVDRVAIGKAAHKLKGGCANIYAHSLQELAYSLEKGAHDASPEILAGVAERLQREFTRTCDFLNDTSVVPLPNQAVS